MLRGGGRGRVWRGVADCLFIYLSAFFGDGSGGLHWWKEGEGGRDGNVMCVYDMYTQAGRQAGG